MSYSVEKQKGAVKINFEIGEDEWNKEMSETYLRTRGKYNVPGFRKGHAPRGIIESMYGKGVFFDDAFESVFRRVYFEALEKEDWIFPVDDPKVDLGEMNDEKFTFSALVTVKPEVKLGKYKGLEVPKADVSVSDEEVDHELQHKREHLTRFVTVNDRAVASGDIITLDYSGSVDGVKFAGGTAEKQELEIGSHSFIPGFEEQLVGVKLGETTDIKVKFPSDYHAAELAGKDAVFTVTVHEIKMKEVPELDDEFARDVNNHVNTLQELKDDIRKEIAEHKEQHATADSENEMLKMIADGAEIEVPQCMVNREVDYLISDFEMQLKNYYGGMKLADYLRYTGMKLTDMRRQRGEQAMTNVKVRLALEKIIEAEKIEVSDSELAAEVEKRLEAEKAEAKAHGHEFTAPAADEMNRFVKSDLLMNKVVEFLKANNKFVPKKEEKADQAKKAPAKKSAAKTEKASEEKPETKKPAASKAKAKKE